MTEAKLATEQVDALYRRHADGVQCFLVGVLRNADLVEEALQQTFVQVMEKGHTADDETMKGWIYKVAFNQAMALRRRQQVGARILGQLAVDPVLLRDLAPPRVGDRGAIEKEIDKETVERARAAVADLPPEQRDVVHLRFDEGETFAAIATRLGVPLGTALTRMRLALEKLRRKLT